jgi:DinB superfamily
MDYIALSLSDLVTEFGTMARDTQAVFDSFSERQLNWQPEETRWSVAQCFDHLLLANASMFQSMDAAMQSPGSRTVWQRIPILPRIYGVMLIKSQAPETKRRFTAPRQARPAASAIEKGIIGRFVAHQHEAAERVRSLAGRDVKRIMASPFNAFISYSVLDGCRLIAAHQRRHFEQARRVIQEPGFPRHA